MDLKVTFGGSSRRVYANILYRLKAESPQGGDKVAKSVSPCEVFVGRTGLGAVVRVTVNLLRRTRGT